MKLYRITEEVTRRIPIMGFYGRGEWGEVGSIQKTFQVGQVIDQLEKEAYDLPSVGFEPSEEELEIRFEGPSFSKYERQNFPKGKYSVYYKSFFLGFRNGKK